MGALSLTDANLRIRDDGSGYPSERPGGASESERVYTVEASTVDLNSTWLRDGNGGLKSGWPNRVRGGESRPGRSLDKNVGT